jgi:hypothetical protein
MLETPARIQLPARPGLDFPQDLYESIATFRFIPQPQ